MKVHLATCCRNEGPYLVEWIAYHRLIGFDTITIFTNDNDDGSDQMLEALQASGIIRWIPRVLAADESPQLSAYRQLSKEIFARPEMRGDYLGWLDADEFLVLKRYSSVRKLLESYGTPDALTVNWRHFGSAGQKDYDPRLTIERFTRCSETTKLNNLFKTITRIVPELFQQINNHRPVIKKGKTVHAIYPDGKAGAPVPVEYLNGRNPVSDADAPVYFEDAQLNHYAVRSLEEYEWKRARGNGRLASDVKRMHFDDNYFVKHDLNESEDMAILRCLDALKDEITSFPEDVLAMDRAYKDTLAQRSCAGSCGGR